MSNICSWSDYNIRNVPAHLFATQFSLAHFSLVVGQGSRDDLISTDMRRISTAIEKEHGE